MESYKMWIGGKWVDAESGKTFAILNPSTEEELGQVPLGTKADVDKAVKAAVEAFPVWSKMPQGERAKIVYRIAGATDFSGGP
jgi:acyl-CoA reductase-like NAD-dependent aldehyde dehydrogenase